MNREKKHPRSVRCFVFNCQNGYRPSTKKISLFGVPKDAAKREIWARAIGRPDKKLEPYHTVCENHFMLSDIVRSWKYQDMEVKYRVPKLKPTAVPCYFSYGNNFQSMLKECKVILEPVDLIKKEIILEKQNEHVSEIVSTLFTTDDHSSLQIPSSEISVSTVSCSQVSEKRNEAVDSIDSVEITKELNVDKQLNTSTLFKSPVLDNSSPLKNIVVEENIPSNLQNQSFNIQNHFYGQQNIILVSRERKRLFFTMWKKIVLINVPNNSWAVHSIEAKRKKQILIVECTISNIHNLRILRQIIIEENLQCTFIFNGTILSGELLQRFDVSPDVILNLMDLENRIENFSKIGFCLGGPSTDMYPMSKVQSRVAVESSGIWRHVKCMMIVENQNPQFACCGFCSRLFETLQKNLYIKQKRETTITKDFYRSHIIDDYSSSSEEIEEPVEIVKKVNLEIDDNQIEASSVTYDESDFKNEVCKGFFGVMSYNGSVCDSVVLNSNNDSSTTDVLEHMYLKQCRLCAELIPRIKLMPIFMGKNEQFFVESVALILQNTITKNDGLPQDICKKCCMKLKQCIEIIETFRKADKKLRSCDNDPDVKYNLKEHVDWRNLTDDQEKQANADMLDAKKTIKPVNMTPRNYKKKPMLPKTISQSQDILERPNELEPTKQIIGLSEEKLSTVLKDQEKPLQPLGSVGHRSNDNLEQVYQVSENGVQKQCVITTELNETDNKSTTFFENSKTEVKLPSNIKYQCLFCLILFSTVTEFDKHVLRMHPFSVEKHKNLFRLVKAKKLTKHFKQKCVECDMQFNSHNLYIAHRKREHAKKTRMKKNRRQLKCTNLKRQFICDNCGDKFTSKIRLSQHMEVHTGHKAYVCKVCGADFDKKSSLYKHIRSEHNAGGKCEKCGKTFRTGVLLTRHRSKHDSHLCCNCGKLFSTAKNLAIHMYVHEGSSRVSCDICSKEFKNIYILNIHKRIKHSPLIENRYICHHCGNRFNTSQSLKQHLNLHYPKRYKCEVCGKAFSRKFNLTIHKKGHEVLEDAGSFKCDICNIDLCNKNNFVKHMSGIHKECPKPFSCDECSKRFKVKHALTVHQRFHTGERPFKCRFCGKAFRSKSTKCQHELIHQDIYPYDCNTCDRKFKHYTSLSVHLKTHTGVRPYPCPTCGRAFANLGDMKRHMYIHRRNNIAVQKINEEIGTLLVNESSIKDEFSSIGNINNTDQTTILMEYAQTYQQKNDYDMKFAKIVTLSTDEYIIKDKSMTNENIHNLFYGSSMNNMDTYDVHNIIETKNIDTYDVDNITGTENRVTYDVNNIIDTKNVNTYDVNNIIEIKNDISFDLDICKTELQINDHFYSTLS